MYNSAFAPQPRNSRVGVYFSPRKRHHTRAQANLLASLHTPLPKRSPPREPNAPKQPDRSNQDDTEPARLYIPGPTHDFTRGKESKIPVANMIQRPLLQLYALVKHGNPPVNAAAVAADYHTKRISIDQDWDDLRPHDKEATRILLDAIYREDKGVYQMLQVRYSPQVEAFLENEADASGAFRANVLNPAIDIINTVFLEHAAKHSDHKLKVILSCEHSVANLGTSTTSALDYAISLVTWPPHQGHRHLLRFDLLIVEMKRPGYILLEDFESQHLKRNDSRGRRLIAQPMLYCKNTGCERFLLSDYLSTVAVHVDHATVDGGEPVHVAARPVVSRSHGSLEDDMRNMILNGRVTPYNMGPLAAVIAECWHALRGLGLIDYGADRPLFPGAEKLHGDGEEVTIELPVC
ncbi:hypothetical protein JCM11641_005917 [Rhodosporidiobolus odoratus]